MASFSTMEVAEQRARDLVADGTWLNAHVERTFTGAIAIRFQRYMSPAAPDQGAWIETSDDTVV